MQRTIPTNFLVLAFCITTLFSRPIHAQWQEWAPFGSFAHGDMIKHNGAFFLASHGQLLKRSVDDGATWENLDLPASSRSIHVHNGYLFTGTLEGVFRSSDMGDTWVDVNGIIPTNTQFTSRAIKRFRTVNGRLFALMGQLAQEGMYYSDDDGETWVDATFGTYNIRNMVDKNGVLFCTSFYAAYRSYDMGETWTQCSPTVGAFWSGHNIAFVNDRLLVMRSQGPAMSYSDDFGDTWTDIDYPYPVVPGIECVDTEFFEGMFWTNWGYMLAVSADGQEWTPMNDGLPPMANGDPYQTHRLRVIDGSLYALGPYKTMVLRGTTTGVVQSLTQDLVVSPNPSQGPVNVVLPAGLTDNATYHVYTTAGVLVLEGSTRGDALMLEMPASGIYLLQVNDGSKLLSARIMVE